MGDEAPTLSHELTRTDLVMYAGASGDFNPMHHDEVTAQAAGLPERVRPRHVLDGPARPGASPTTSASATCTRYKVRFTKQTWPGEVLTSKVVVTGKREEDGEQLVDLEVTLANGDGEVKVRARRSRSPADRAAS